MPDDEPHGDLCNCGAYGGAQHALAEGQCHLNPDNPDNLDDEEDYYL